MMDNVFGVTIVGKEDVTIIIINLYLTSMQQYIDNLSNQDNKEILLY